MYNTQHVFIFTIYDTNDRKTDPYTMKAPKLNKITNQYQDGKHLLLYKTQCETREDTVLRTVAQPSSLRHVPKASVS